MEKSIVRATVCLVLVLGGLGCGSEHIPMRKTPAGPGAVYVNRKLRKTYKKPIGEVHAATIAGMEELGLTVAQKSADKIRGNVTGVMADGTDVHVEMESVADGTFVTIQAGLIGDKLVSVNVMKAIDEQLGVETTEPQTAEPQTPKEETRQEAESMQEELQKNAPEAPVEPPAEEE